MGWAQGIDERGRAIGYAVRATCDQTFCRAKVWRGVESACGGVHGVTATSCDRYVCPDHRSPTGRCLACAAKYECPECGELWPRGGTCPECRAEQEAARRPSSSAGAERPAR